MNKSEAIQEILKWLTIGSICLAYNKPISNEIARLYLLPIKWVTGEKQWMVIVRQYLAIWVRITLYGGVVISSLGIIFAIGTFFHL